MAVHLGLAYVFVPDGMKPSGSCTSSHGRSTGCATVQSGTYSPEDMSYICIVPTAVSAAMPYVSVSGEYATCTSISEKNSVAIL